MIFKNVLGLSVLLIALFLIESPIARAGDQGKAGAAASEGTKEYAGSDICQTCHEDLYKKSFEFTPHFKTTLKNGHGCETCHGPGSEHVAAGGDAAKIIGFKHLSREQASARCLSCHGKDSERAHFKSSPHASSDVGCLDCHSPHHSKQEQRLLVQSQPQLCYQCHSTTKADFAKPFRHRVNEGLVQCSDCHNVHGSSTLRQARSLPSGDPVCGKCHADKRGPFVYEHVPVRTEGCTSCHTPHGSTNPRFLRVSQVNLLCLQCHTVPTQSPIGPAHNQSARYQACTMCHPAIHGSNANFAFLK